MKLAEERCEPCRVGTPALSHEQAVELLTQTPKWTLFSDRIEREFRFGDFREAVSFVNKVADAAEEHDHHPDILISYNKVKLEIRTHKIGGLSRNDFVLAAKIDRLA